MDPHLSSESTGALALMSKEVKTTLATHKAAEFTCNETAGKEREGTATKVIGSASGIVPDRSTLPRLPSSLKELMENQTS